MWHTLTRKKRVARESDKSWGRLTEPNPLLIRKSTGRNPILSRTHSLCLEAYSNWDQINGSRDVCTDPRWVYEPEIRTFWRSREHRSPSGPDPLHQTAAAASKWRLRQVQTQEELFKREQGRRLRRDAPTSPRSSLQAEETSREGQAPLPLWERSWQAKEG